jgi:polysaccharide export outer membrane protein
MRKIVFWKGLFLLGIVALLSIPAGTAQGAAETDYIIGPGDVLIVSVWKDESLTREVTVLPDGTISFPLVGEFAASGKTVKELKTDIEDRIKRYVPDPVLSVAVKSVNSMFIYVIGRVNIPGRYVLNSRVNVLQGLAMAGGLNPFANNNAIKIIRSDGDILNFRYNDVAKGKNLEQNILLKRGDVILVP